MNSIRFISEIACQPEKKSHNRQFYGVVLLAVKLCNEADSVSLFVYFNRQTFK